MTKAITIHTSRTIMYAELSKVMDFALEHGNYHEALNINVTGKKSGSGIEKTANYLRQLYRFDLNYPPFAAFRYFWKLADQEDKSQLAFIYAINHDYLLAESIDVIKGVQPGTKAAIELFEEYIEQLHPNHYSKSSLKSISQNIASSWKQAGFIEGKVKNIRVQPKISHRVACFAFLLAFIKGDQGDFIWNSAGVKALCLTEAQLREFAVECAKRDMIQYYHAGSVTTFNFNNLLKKIGIDGNEN